MEEKRAKLRKVEFLPSQIKEEKAKLRATFIDNDGQDSFDHFPLVSGASNIADMKKAIPSSMPLDGLLQHLDPAGNNAMACINHLPSWNGQVQPMLAGQKRDLKHQHQRCSWNQSIYPKGEKVRRSYDLVTLLIILSPERKKEQFPMCEILLWP